MEGNVKQIVRFFDELKGLNMEPHTFAFNKLIEAYGFHKNLQASMDTFTEMGKKGIPKDVTTYNTVFQICGNCLNADVLDLVFPC